MRRKYPKKYPREVRAFQSHINRCKNGYATTVWSLTAEDFEAFFRYVGPIPEEMIRPTLGRLDHSKGYEPGNIEWQPWSKNCKPTDPVTLKRLSAWQIGRKRTFSDEHKKNISLAQTGRALTPEWRKQISLSRIGLKVGPLTSAHKEKISRALKNREFSIEHKKNIAVAQRERRKREKLEEEIRP